MKKKNIAAIIPTRMGSSRFPGKPLAKILGLEMIEHVRRRVSMCDKLSEVVVATCDEEIGKVVEGYGGRVIMTSDRHERCTDRIAEAARHLDAQIIVNVQGDEPLVIPQMVSQVLQPMLDDSQCECVNLVSVIRSEDEFKNPNVVKAVLDTRGYILYFSRSPVPFYKKAVSYLKKYKQLGIIAFTKPLLVAYAKMKQTPIEKAESVDMMRLLENGYPVKAAVAHGALYGVDTPNDLKRAESMMRRDKFLRRYM